MANIVDNREIVIMLRSIIKRLEALERESAKQPVRIAGGGGGGTKILHIAANFTALDALTGIPDGHFGYTEDTDKGYQRLNGAWKLYTHFNV